MIVCCLFRKIVEQVLIISIEVIEDYIAMQKKLSIKNGNVYIVIITYYLTQNCAVIYPVTNNCITVVISLKFELVLLSIPLNLNTTRLFNQPFQLKTIYIGLNNFNNAFILFHYCDTLKDEL